MSETRKRRGPTLIEDDFGDLPEVPAGAAEAPPVDDVEQSATAAAVRIASGERSAGGTVAKIFWGALLSLMLMALGLWFWETVEALLSRNLWLGRIALILTAVAVTALLILAMRELAGLSRLRRIDHLREAGEQAHAARDRVKADEVLSELDRLYRTRPEMAEARQSLAARKVDILDGDALIDTAERSLFLDLDASAETEIRRAARNVATATAFVPFALVDVLTALFVNLAMIRRIAEIYGGRAGWLGSWRLLRAVAAHLVAAGAMAVGDDLIGPALGGGALSKLSRRFGEGLVNGALTARIGVAAVEVCRPLPFRTLPKPGVGALIKGALKGLMT